MSQRPLHAELPAPSSAARRLIAQARLCASFYLGLGMPASYRRFADCRVWAAAGHSPELMYSLVSLYAGDGEGADGEVEEVNFRCAAITPAGSRQRFFVKELRRRRLAHDVERALRCSRGHRAWRAAHLLPRLGIKTPPPVGRALARARDGCPVEYVATEWIDDAVPFQERLRAAGCGLAARADLLREFARNLRYWNDCGLYLHDLVKNVATRESAGGLEYWLTDLDQLHPARRLTRRRLLHQMGQLAYWSAPLRPEEAQAIATGYLGGRRRGLSEMMERILLAAPPGGRT
jgi:hypothetical protein